MTDHHNGSSAAKGAAAALAVAAALILGGCSGIVDPSTPGTTAANYVESSASWAPKEPIEHRTYTEAEKLEWRQQWLKSKAYEFDIENPPEVELTRWTTTPQDAGQAEAECLTQAGFPASYDIGSGGVIFSGGGVPDSQSAALYNASFTCWAKYTPVPSLRTDWNTDQLGLMYDYWTEAFVPCMESRGYSIEEPPSREVFVDTFYTVPENRWWPDSSLMSVPEAEREHVVEACPAMPAPKHFYG